MAVNEAHRQTLTEKLARLPVKPGVYLMKNRTGEIIYIGKAKSLRHRVRSYFQDAGPAMPRQISMISHIDDFEYIVTDSEVEALILEATLIRDRKPRYNVNLKDDKKFPYIKITSEPFPRILVTRRLEKDGGKYFGPYTEAKKMRSLLKMLRQIFPVRTCSRLPGPDEGRACLYSHIGKCLAPCLGSESIQESYHIMIDQIGHFLSGHTSVLLAEVEKEMRKAAGEQRFEEAARLRDQLQYVQRITMKQKVVSTAMIDRDMIVVAKDGGLACGVVLQVRDGRLIGREFHFLRGTRDALEEEVLATFVGQHYLGTTFIPEEICLGGSIDDEENMAGWLSRRSGKRVRLSVPRRGEKMNLVLLARQNAELLLAEARLKRESDQDNVPHAVLELQRALGLRRPPRHIEAFDISNLGGTDAVGSMVSFHDGKPCKSDYRRFKVKRVAGQDDYAMMREVVGRRYRRLLEEGKSLPDLVLIDGGRGHLSSALEILHGLGLNEPEVIGLAKRLDEIYLPHLPDPQNIPKSSSALRLLQHVRDEAHRFAVRYHRDLRKKRTVHSSLEEIPGVGDKRRTALLRHFGSLRRLKQASVEEIEAVKGISTKLAQQIHEALHSAKSLRANNA